MATGEPIHKLIVHFKGNQYPIKNVSSVRYKHMEMLYDVSELAFKDIPSHLGMYITINLPIPGSSKTMELQNDAAMIRMYQLYQKIENIHVLLKVSQNPPLVAAPPPQTEISVKDEKLEFAEPGQGSNRINLSGFIAKKKRKKTAPEKVGNQRVIRKLMKLKCLLGSGAELRQNICLIDSRGRNIWRDFRDEFLNNRYLNPLMDPVGFAMNNWSSEKWCRADRALRWVKFEAAPGPEAHMQPLEPLHQPEPLQQPEAKPEEVKPREDDSASNDEWAWF